MMEAMREAVALEPEELVELEQIVLDGDREAAYSFLKNCVYERVVAAQHSRLKSHLEGAFAGSFKRKKK
jgi:hypothetical protein